MGALISNLKPIVTAIAAIVMFSLPLRGATADIDALLQQLQGADSVQAGKIDREIALEWSKTGSASMDLLLKRGRDALDISDYAAAIDHFTALTDHAPFFAEGWHGRARAYFATGLVGPALADLEQTLALNPRNYQAIYGLAVILEQLEQYDAAYDAFAQVLELHPNHANSAEALTRLTPRVNGVKL
jgi:tetratricopeptide (TPR) repeat protein